MKRLIERIIIILAVIALLVGVELFFYGIGKHTIQTTHSVIQDTPNHVHYWNKWDHQTVNVTQTGAIVMFQTRSCQFCGESEIRVVRLLK